MAFGSEERRRLVVDTIRRDGQLTRGGDRSAFAVALASVEFDLAGVLKDGHAVNDRGNSPGAIVRIPHLGRGR